ncbi:MAG: hypothetical protein CR986_00940 [Ignavibacteriae bacterium]|nr:MAG: hypothetical protein CR986_00940 [Ignavibacteriota bacterium]
MINLLKRLLYVYIFVYLSISGLYFFKVINEVFLISTVYAGVLNLFNVLLALVLYAVSVKKTSSKFMIYNFGGVVARLFINIPIIIIVIKFLNIDKYAFILVLFLFYFISLGLEVLFYTKNSQKKLKVNVH